MSTHKQKIAIFHNLPHGGAKRYIYEISKILKEKYDLYEYTLSTSSNYLPIDVNVKKTFRYHYKPGSNLFWFLFNSFFRLNVLQRRIAKDIDSKNYKCVLVNHDFITKSPYVLRYLKTKKIYICHEPQREFYETMSLHSPRFRDKIVNFLRYPIKEIDKFNTKKADILIANSKYSQSVLKRIYKRNSVLLYPGVDSTFFKPLQIKKKMFLISIGGLLPVKGHDFLIESLALLKEPPRLVIVGGGRKVEMDRLSKLAKENNVSISFSKELDDINLRKYYNSAFCLLSASHKEPFGLSIIEAMSCGIPVVVVKSGGVGEQVVNNQVGYVVKFRNKAKFAQKILLAIKKHKTLGKKARSYVLDNWQWRNSFSVLENTIETCTKSH